jgi:hypothetical protein
VWCHLHPRKRKTCLAAGSGRKPLSKWRQLRATDMTEELQCTHPRPDFLTFIKSRIMYKNWNHSVIRDVKNTASRPHMAFYTDTKKCKHVGRQSNSSMRLNWCLLRSQTEVRDVTDVYCSAKLKCET